MGVTLERASPVFEIEDAKEFAKLSDKRVAEHAPFFVYGIYKLPHKS